MKKAIREEIDKVAMRQAVCQSCDVPYTNDVDFGSDHGYPVYRSGYRSGLDRVVVETEDHDFILQGKDLCRVAKKFGPGWPADKVDYDGVSFRALYPTIPPFWYLLRDHKVETFALAAVGLLLIWWSL